MVAMGGRGLMLVLLCGCGPDVHPPADLVEFCGAAEPVRILELPEDEPLASVVEATRVGSRRLVSVNYTEETDDVDVYPFTDRQELWSLGECGESPILLSDRRGWLVTYPTWPDLHLFCDDETGEVRALDPEAPLPSNVVFRDQDCSSAITSHGLVTVDPHDEDTTAVVLYPWVDDPFTEAAAPEVLLDPVRMRVVPTQWFPSYRQVLAVVDDAVFAVTLDDELVRLSLVDRSLAVVAEHVREFEVSDDGRYVMWQDLTQTNDDDNWPAGAVYLLDRDTGTATHLADAPLAGTHFPFQFYEHGIVHLRLGYLYKEPDRFWRLDDMSFVDVPDNIWVHRRLEDGRWFAGDHFGAPYHLFDPTLASSQPFFVHKGDFEYVDGGVEIIQGVQCCIEDDLARPEGRLWFVPWDGERQLLADRVTSPWTKVHDGRILTVLDVDDAWLGNLFVVDPDDREERLIDRDVSSHYKPIGADNVTVYGVHDGDRTGVWVAKLGSR